MCLFFFYGSGLSSLEMLPSTLHFAALFRVQVSSQLKFHCWGTHLHLNELNEKPYRVDRLIQYWVIQVGLLTPLTFARHRLSPLAAFTSGAYFLHNWRRWQWICEFYAANFEGIFGGSCYRRPQNAFFSTKSRSSGQPKKRRKDFFPHPPSLFPSNFCNCNSGGICTASQF